MNIAVMLVPSTFAVLILVGVVVWQVRSNQNRTDVIFAVLSGAVALLLITGQAALILRFDQYVQVTLARDDAQERCNVETISALKSWLTQRINNEQAEAVRDQAWLVVINKLGRGEKPTEAEMSTYIQAFSVTQDTRNQMLTQFQAMPNCVVQPTK